MLHFWQVAHIQLSFGTNIVQMLQRYRTDIVLMLLVWERVWLNTSTDNVCIWDRDISRSQLGLPWGPEKVLYSIRSWLNENSRSKLHLSLGQLCPNPPYLHFSTFGIISIKWRPSVDTFYITFILFTFIDLLYCFCLLSSLCHWCNQTFCRSLSKETDYLLNNFGFNGN